MLAYSRSAAGWLQRRRVSATARRGCHLGTHTVENTLRTEAPGKVETLGDERRESMWGCRFGVGLRTDQLTATS